MARESALWSSFSKSARKEIADCGILHMERIENMLGAGTPDVEGFVKFFGTSDAPPLRGQFAIELKSSERPAKNTTPVRFKLRGREAQIEWMRKRWELGGNAFFLLQVGSGHDRILYLAPGNMGEALKNGIIETAIAIACLETGVFTPPISAKDILHRVISCRRSPYRKSLSPS